MLRRNHERAITAALVLSALVHLAVIIRMPKHEAPDTELTRSGPDSLSVQLMPQERPSPPRPPPVIAPEPAPSPPPRRARTPRIAPPPPPAARPPPVLAMREPAAAPALPRTPSATPVPAPAPPAADLASYVEARRRARGDIAPPDPQAVPVPSGDNANARANRLAAANIGTPAREMTFGFDPRRSGGVFSVQRMSYDYAEFMFFGWNQDARRNLAQLITVNKGGAADIRLAVVRRMIGIIRDYEQEDFVWESERLGRNVTLSARVRDTRGLEDFLLREFFPEWRRP